MGNTAAAWRKPAKETLTLTPLPAVKAVVRGLAGKKAVGVDVEVEVENVPKIDGHRQLDYDTKLDVVQVTWRRKTKGEKNEGGRDERQGLVGGGRGDESI